MSSLFYCQLSNSIAARLLLLISLSCCCFFPFLCCFMGAFVSLLRLFQYFQSLSPRDMVSKTINVAAYLGLVSGLTTYATTYAEQPHLDLLLNCIIYLLCDSIMRLCCIIAIHSDCIRCMCCICERTWTRLKAKTKAGVIC